MQAPMFDDRTKTETKLPLLEWILHSPVRIHNVQKHIQSNFRKMKVLITRRLQKDLIQLVDPELCFEGSWDF